MAPVDGSETRQDLQRQIDQLKQQIHDLDNQNTKPETNSKHAYVLVKGMIVESENVFMESMDVDAAKRWCNSNVECRGFTFFGPDERPQDDVTITFKAGSKIAHDAKWISYVKQDTTIFGHMHAGMALDQASRPGLVEHGITFESICIVFALVLVVVFMTRQTWKSRRRNS